MRILGNRIQVRPLAKDEKASETIFYAPQHQPEQMFHEVVGVGTGRKLKNGTVVELPVKVGDRVLLSQYDLNQRTDAGDGSWIVNMDACSLVVET